ncbi:zinc finger MYM-type protein 1-like [Hydra vulgaris]|uniref:zinc finger MYM-type protein 1-like n=1 Tax=Hydra vulgaris TaxID=6087 RepID=UPI0002B41EAB|nr:zinc finger MYM-type protein 1-like [Hydra vulgaris]
MAYHHKSGYQKAKDREDKKKREEAIISKTVKITELFPTISVNVNREDPPSNSPLPCVGQCGLPGQFGHEFERDNSVAAVCTQSISHSESDDMVDAETLSQKPEAQAGSKGSKDDNSFSTDIGQWSEVEINDTFCNFWVTRGSECCQHSNADFTSSMQIDGKQMRYCSQNLFYRVHSRNGEKVPRSWLCYSPATSRIYCFVCKLFSADDNSFLRNGFCDWKNAASRIQSHENSIAHRNATSTFSQRVQVRGCVDSAIVEQYRQECAYAKSVLERVVSVIKFLAERGLAFRGHTEILGSSSNGNFLGILELIAQFDPFLSSYIDNHGGKGKDSVSYLSSTICDELIDVMGKQVMKTILSEIRGAKFYSISVDSTPDISHVDRLMKGHGAEDLFNSLYSFLEEAKLDIKYCRGQSYDNASNVAGKYSGLQARIREKNPLAEYVPCFAHSLNLVGASAVNCVTTVSGFFDFVQNLYVFLNASTQRWELLTKGLDSNQLVLKRLSDTRWSAHSAATKALSKGFKYVKTVLENIAEDPEEKVEARTTAAGIAKKMDQLEYGILLELWTPILDRFHKTSLKLQSPQLDLNEAVQLLTSLKEYVNSLRAQFYFFEKKGKEITGSTSYKEENQRKRERSVQLTRHDGSADETVFSAQQKFRVMVFLPVLDHLNSALCKRSEAYSGVCDKFGFLRNIRSLEQSDLRRASRNLIDTYVDDFEESFEDEILHFKEYLFADTYLQQNEKELKCSIELYMYRALRNSSALQDIFPNVATALHIYLSLMITNCSDERSFSALKRIKNYLRSALGDDKLNSLTVMCTESDILRSCDFNEILSDFVERKCRKMNF